MNKSAKETFLSDLAIGTLYNLDLRNTWKEYWELSKTFKWLFVFLIASLTGYFFFVGDYSFWGVLSFVGLLFVSLNLVLVDNRKLTNYLWGTLASVTSIIGVYHYHMYGDFTYYLYVFPWQAIGVVEWVRLMRIRNAEESTSRILKPKGILIYTILWIVSYVVMYFISIHVNGSVPLIDSAILSFGIVGQTLMSKSYRSQWAVWLMQNTVALIAWSYRLDIAYRSGESISFPLSMIIMWGIMLINAVFGYVSWMKASRPQKEAKVA
jgi:nicotinamide mononucleotide transporter PnuC